MPRICGVRKRTPEGVKICRRRPNHEGDHHFMNMRSSVRPQHQSYLLLHKQAESSVPLAIAAHASELNNYFPEGDYTEMISRVYINGRNIFIEFKGSNQREIEKGRKKWQP